LPVPPDAGFFLGIAVEVLMHAIGRDVDEIALAPFEALGLLFPAELHLVIAIKQHIPMQVVAIAFDNVEDLFRQMTMLARGFTGRNELLVQVATAFLGVHLLIDDVFDKAVGRTFQRHLARLHDVHPALVVAAELF
jgi:hypothetical protein